MKKILKRFLSFTAITVFALFALPANVSAADLEYDSYLDDESIIDKYPYHYVIEDYDVDIYVNDDNTFDITEKITAYFKQPKHGIYRKIPLRNTVERLDGSKSTNRAKVKNVTVNDKFETSKKGEVSYEIKIGDADRTLTGRKEYIISYHYDIGKDKSKDFDELYFNIIGNEWDTALGDIDFTIRMPKEFDESKLGFSSGVKGSTDNSNITYNVSGRVIEGSYHGELDVGEGLTVRLELPEGYFIAPDSIVNKLKFLLFLIPGLGLGIAFFLWYKFGKDEQVIETVEFYPPEGFNSLEIGYLYKGKASAEDVVSLLVYLANKGYIKISEIEEKVLFSTKKGFKITKLKEYDGNNENERIFLNGLFVKSRRSVLKSILTETEADDLDATTPGVTSSDLYNQFYITLNAILRNTNTKENKRKIFEGTTSSKSLAVIGLIALSIITILTIITLDYAGTPELFNTFMITLFYAPFYAVIFIKKVPILFKIFWGGFTILHSFAFFISLPIAEAVRDNVFYLIAVIFGLACIGGMVFFLKAMPKRTPYGNEILGKIKGFKTFLETAEKDKLEAMVMENPSYFYDILPYTYVLGISDKWINQFETIALQAPDWYDGCAAGFSAAAFGSFMHDTMSSAQSSMTSSPSSSSGGGSGGGSSGGGSGGGGGGSW